MESGRLWQQSGAGGGAEWKKEVNNSDLFWLLLFLSIWNGMGGNRFAVNI